MIAAVNDPYMTLKWYVYLVACTAALVTCAIWAYHVVRDLRGKTDPDGGSPEDLLSPLEQAFESGQMSEAEYARVRASVGKVLPGDKPSPTTSSNPEHEPGSNEGPGPH